MFAAFALLLAAVVYRIVSGFVGSDDFQWLHNFAPVAAVALCGAVYLPRRVAVALPLAMLLISDLILNLFHYNQGRPAFSGSMTSAPFFTMEILPRYVALLLISGLGFAIRGRVNLLRLLGASVVGSLIFYLLSNTGSWLYEARYAKTAAGWLQAMTIGLPGTVNHPYPPTWWFYRHTLLSDLFFTLLFVACMKVQGKKESVVQSASIGELARP